MINFKLLRYLDIPYFSKLFLLFLVFYYFNIVFWGITDPKNYYSYFLDHYFNYIDWFGVSILWMANLITHLVGLTTYIVPPEIIKISGGVTVILSFDCLGLGIISFWVAFVIAHIGTWQKKIYWSIVGVAFIWFINCCRIALLIMALDMQWKEMYYIDHHDMFNLIAYSIILVLMYFYSQEGKLDINQSALI